ncbi:purine-cytosine permease family protein [Georgenia thermotolerans]|uniref:Cytosine permease n=1 Tax=Georgenia thermotolerans TaxID=527326 RepID=A0A7J5UNL9_9MICO|nr:cytosine permease [Georgenia thermotolerans]KAE8763996.1 cytosine permease [Georgenia thermotolerans]
MTTTSSHDSASVHDLEQQLQPIPEGARTTKVSGQFWIWCGANIAPINWVLGALGVGLGLGLADTLTVLILGNLIGMAIFGLFVLMGQKTGVTGMVLSRAAFGRRGNYLPACIQGALSIGWCAVNTWIILDLVMALLGKLGVVDPTAANYPARILVAAFLMAVQVAISWRGYRAIAAFERWTVPPTIAILVLMSVVAWFFLDIDWSYAGPSGAVLAGGERLAAMTAIMTAIGIGWGITWFTYAADYSRFVSTSMPRRKLYLASTLGQFVPVVWLGVLGATLATKNGTVDPGQLIVENFGALAVPVLLLVLHGPIATNILNIYTFSVATQALDIKIPRRTLSVLVGVLAMLVVIFFIFQENFAAVLDSWLIGLVAWVATWGGIMLVHYYRIERQAVRVDRLFDAPGTRRLPDLNWAAYVAFFVGVFCTWLFMYGVLPVFRGPVATALGGVDLSWLAGGVAAAAVYAVLGPIVAAKYTEDVIVADVTAAYRAPARPGPAVRAATPVADATGTAEPLA